VPDPSVGYERELGGINSTLRSIETTLTGLGSELKLQRDESGVWRQGFRSSLEEHAARTDDAIDALSERTRALETDLATHKTEDERGRRLIWRVLLGSGAGGGSVFVAWTQAKAAMLNLFR
jgi:hypothetical protein